MEGIASIRLTGEDIVRHRLVRDIVDAYRVAEDAEKENGEEDGEEEQEG